MLKGTKGEEGEPPPVSLETIEPLCPRACLDLAMVLGLGLLLEEEDLHLPEVLGLKWWLERVRSARITSRVELSSLWLPQGMNSETLHIEEQIEVRPEHEAQ